MTDEDKTKEQFITELVELRKRITELENSEIQHNQTEETLDGRFITVNPSLAHIFGYKLPEEFLFNSTSQYLLGNKN